ncbi:Nramp family divalent metal transporter [Candidatus Falkowbacteria bacterium]|nr:MAG: Nramp family divalent metal transporter [Candidatus Falkowbacteria bacterium]
MKKIKAFLKKLGPGFITGASDDDPSGIATYSQTGSQFGYSQLWTALFSFPFMTIIQEICGRIGMVTGKGLAKVVKEHYGRTVLFGAVAILCIANTINIGADLGAMAAAGQLLIGFPFLVWLLVITGITLALEIFVSYATYARFLKYLTLSLFAYVVTAFVIKQDWSEIIFSTLVPSFSFSRLYLLNIVAILGTTISPYLFFWQADEEVEEEIANHKLTENSNAKPRINYRDIRRMRVDTFIGMLFSNLVMFFIIVTTASTLGVHGLTTITTADQAAAALRPLAGDFAFLLFAAGIIGTGLLAVPILAGSASYALAETFNWKAGLGKKFNQAKAFYVIIIISTLVGVLINFTPIQPFQMLYYTAILNGICAPPLLILIMLISRNKKIMGQYTNSGLSNTMGWIIAVVMSLAAIALIITI